MPPLRVIPADSRPGMQELRGQINGTVADAAVILFKETWEKRVLLRDMANLRAYLESTGWAVSGVRPMYSLYRRADKWSDAQIVAPSEKARDCRRDFISAVTELARFEGRERWLVAKDIVKRVGAQAGIDLRFARAMKLRDAVTNQESVIHECKDR